MKMRPHCFLRPILRPVAVFALAFGVTSMMLSAQDEETASDADAAVTETAEEAVPDSEDSAVEAEVEETAGDAEAAGDEEVYRFPVRRWKSRERQ